MTAAYHPTYFNLHQTTFKISPINPTSAFHYLQLSHPVSPRESHPSQTIPQSRSPVPPPSGPDSFITPKTEPILD
ncbi:uncharacterized protein BDR25DRAFT_67694 [Lindgomyces ingoldianus]|uniref:Uncharacterized protein n=1 Tax=Lindgomyces ingoldianus TaxID=673940 RepID=A0ACB6RBI5_9PLEO|nr:uncharacterized protein BDR25DRAFT_67694 [Lindgomyces ingoldianus]KAF2476604.1 hypothetical protein BDR25DRAFT_67694 [Lindgomyces ingoldianus]